MKRNKKIVKVAGAACAAAAVVAVSALVASGAAAGAIAEGFKSAGNIVKNILSNNQEPETVERQAETIQ